MKNVFRRRPMKAIAYRSNQWKGVRAVQSKDRTMQTRRAELMACWRIVLRVVGGLVAGVAVCWAGLLLARQLGPALQRGLEIREVSVEGMRQVTRQEVLERLALKQGIAQHQVSLTYLAGRLRNHPWIKEATIERLPLHALRVTLVERKPAAIARTASEYLLTDEEGAVLARLGTEDQTTLPLLVGVDGELLAQRDQRMKQRIRSAIGLAKSMAETLDGRIEVDVSHPENIVASARGMRFHLGSDGLNDQWDRFMKVRAAFKVPTFDGRKHDGQDVDLRYDNRVIVREGG
jgi:cell division protein FtsQ